MGDQGRKGVLRHAEDIRVLGFAAMHVAIVAAVIACLRDGMAVWLVAAWCVPALAASAFIQLISTHNAMHTPVFWNKRANRVWQCVLSFCIGYPVSVYVPVHNLSHHLGLQTPKDILRTTEVRHRWNLLNLGHHMAMGTVHLHLLHFAYCAQMRKSRPRWFAQVCWEALAVVLWFALVIWLAGPWALALVWGPNVMGQLLMVGFGYVQHDGCDHEHGFNHSRNFLSPIFNWFIMDNGYHGAHHCKPAVHWSKGRAAHFADVAPNMHPALDERSLVGYMWRAFVYPGKRVRYDGKPVELPPARAKRELWTPASAITAGTSSGAVEG